MIRSQGRVPASLLLLPLLAARAATADPPAFGPGVPVYCGSQRLDAGWHSSPCVTDWNGDGLDDLIVGQFDLGAIRFYENVGSPGAPEFAGFSYLEADGSPIRLPYG